MSVFDDYDIPSDYDVDYFDVDVPTAEELRVAELRSTSGHVAWATIGEDVYGLARQYAAATGRAIQVIEL